MARYPHLINRNGYFYFRIAVPTALMSIIGRKEFWCSLKTKDYNEARTRSWALLKAAQEVFEQAYAGNVPTTSELRERLKWHPVALTARSAPAPAIEKRGESLSVVFEAYIAECHGDRLKTIQKKKAMLRLWDEAMGDMPVQSIGKAQARDFKQLLMRLPSNMHKHYKGKKLKEINLDAIPEDERLSVRSINNNLGYMRAFMNWAIQNGHYEGNNPFTGMTLKEVERPENKRLSFSDAQLKAIFSTPFFTGCKSDKMHERYLPGPTIIKDSMYWIPLIALYSGARLQEIAQLYVSDICPIEGIWVFDINAEGEDKMLKTPSSQRKTPIHPKLIELGLLDYAIAQKKRGEIRLFSDLPRSGDGSYSNIFSKRFNHFLSRFSIKTDKTSFHSFRHTFIDGLRNTDVPREVREALVGHLDKRTAHDNYGSAIGIRRLYEGVMSLKYKL